MRVRVLALRLRTGAPSVPDVTGLALLLGLVALALSPVMYPWALVSDVSAPPDSSDVERLERFFDSEDEDFEILSL